VELKDHLTTARQVHRSKAAQRRASQLFRLAWRSSASETVTGFTAVCARLGVKETTLRARLSASKNAFALKRVNPLTGEPDILVVSYLNIEGKKAKRGRPPKYILDEARMGSEFTDGIVQLKSPAADRRAKKLSDSSLDAKNKAPR
jgi:hypothetical protein